MRYPVLLLSIAVLIMGGASVHAQATQEPPAPVTPTFYLVEVNWSLDLTSPEHKDNFWWHSQDIHERPNWGDAAFVGMYVDSTVTGADQSAIYWSNSTEFTGPTRKIANNNSFLSNYHSTYSGDTTCATVHFTQQSDGTQVCDLFSIPYDRSSNFFTNEQYGTKFLNDNYTQSELNSAENFGRYIQPHLMDEGTNGWQSSGVVTISHLIYFGEPPLEAAFDMLPIVNQYDDVYVTDQSEPQADIVQWAWSWGDGSPGAITTTGAPSDPHIYTEPGTYTISLTVETADGRTDTATKDILVEPVADLVRPFLEEDETTIGEPTTPLLKWWKNESVISTAASESVTGGGDRAPVHAAAAGTVEAVQRLDPDTMCTQYDGALCYLSFGSSTYEISGEIMGNAWVVTVANQTLDPIRMQYIVTAPTVDVGDTVVGGCQIGAGLFAVAGTERFDITLLRGTNAALEPGDVDTVEAEAILQRLNLSPDPDTSCTNIDGACANAGSGFNAGSDSLWASRDATFTGDSVLLQPGGYVSQVVTGLPVQAYTVTIVTRGRGEVLVSFGSESKVVLGEVDHPDTQPHYLTFTAQAISSATDLRIEAYDTNTGNIEILLACINNQPITSIRRYTMLVTIPEGGTEFQPRVAIDDDMLDAPLYVDNAVLRSRPDLTAPPDPNPTCLLNQPIDDTGNLFQGGTFSDPSDAAFWDTFGGGQLTISEGAGQVIGNNPGSNPILRQNVSATVDPNAVYEMSFDLGSTSPAAKQASIIMDTDASGFIVCEIELVPSLVEPVPATACFFANPSFDHQLIGWLYGNPVGVPELGVLQIANGGYIKQQVRLFEGDYKLIVHFGESSTSGQINYSWGGNTGTINAPSLAYEDIGTGIDVVTIPFTVAQPTNDEFEFAAVTASETDSMSIRRVCIETASGTQFPGYEDSVVYDEINDEVNAFPVCEAVSQPSLTVNPVPWIKWAWDKTANLFNCTLFPMIAEELDLSYTILKLLRAYFDYQAQTARSWFSIVGDIIGFLAGHIGNIVLTILEQFTWIKTVWDAVSAALAWLTPKITFLWDSFVLAVTTLFTDYDRFVSTWENASPADIGAPDCINAPRENGLCAAVWALDNTMFADGQPGDLALKIIISTLAVHVFIQIFYDFIREFKTTYANTAR